MIEELRHNFCRNCGKDLNAPGVTFDSCCWEESRIADNKPLTLDQLKERVGMPVYLTCSSHFGKWGEWRVVKKVICDAVEFKGCFGNYSVNDNDFRFYDHNPKGEK